MTWGGVVQNLAGHVTNHGGLVGNAFGKVYQASGACKNVGGTVQNVDGFVDNHFGSVLNTPHESIYQVLTPFSAAATRCRPLDAFPTSSSLDPFTQVLTRAW